MTPVVCRAIEETPRIAWSADTGQAVLTAGRLELVVERKAGINARSLRDLKAGRVYADQDYCWPGGEFPKMMGSPAIKRHENGNCSVAFRGRHGVAFLMFDSDQYSGPCYDKTHGHSIPSTREEHAKAVLELVRRVKKQYPQTLIEVHDFITGPSNIYYVPTYYGYAQPDSFDCLWGHEFMWNSMEDLLAGRAISLYYYNLSYTIPLYLHINLKNDNGNALAFWWFASTCRHLGVGGKSEAKVRESHKKAMQTYTPLKRFYTQGTFYGIDETVHAHTLPDIGESVINVFNLENKPV